MVRTEISESSVNAVLCKPPITPSKNVGELIGNEITRFPTINTKNNQIHLMLLIIFFSLISVNLGVIYNPSICPAHYEAAKPSEEPTIKCYAPCKDGYELKRQMFNACWETCHTVCNGKSTDVGFLCYCHRKKLLKPKKSDQRRFIKPSCNENDVMRDDRCYTSDETVSRSQS